MCSWSEKGKVDDNKLDGSKISMCGECCVCMFVKGSVIFTIVIMQKS